MIAIGIQSAGPQLASQPEEPEIHLAARFNHRPQNEEGNARKQNNSRREKRPF